MKPIDIADATDPLSKFAARAAREAIVVTRRGKPLAAVIPVDDADYESLSLSTNPRFLEILARSRAKLERDGGIPIEEMYRRLGIARSARLAQRKANGRRKKR